MDHRKRKAHEDLDKEDREGYNRQRRPFQHIEEINRFLMGDNDHLFVPPQASYFIHEEVANVDGESGYENFNPQHQRSQQSLGQHGGYVGADPVRSSDLETLNEIQRIRGSQSFSAGPGTQLHGPYSSYPTSLHTNGYRVSTTPDPSMLASLPPPYNFKASSSNPQQNPVSTHQQNSVSQSNALPTVPSFQNPLHFPLAGHVTRFSCDICRTHFQNIGSLKRHERDSHGVTDGLQCLYCHKWLNPQGMRRHVLDVHQGRKRFVCDYDGCTANFTYEESLRSHKRRGSHGHWNGSAPHDAPVNKNAESVDGGDDKVDKHGDDFEEIARSFGNFSPRFDINPGTNQLGDYFNKTAGGFGNSSPGFSMSSGLDGIGTPYLMNMDRGNVQPVNHNEQREGIALLRNSNYESWDPTGTNARPALDTAPSSMDTPYDGLGYHRVDSVVNRVEVMALPYRPSQQFNNMAENSYRPLLPSTSTTSFAPFREGAHATDGSFGLVRTAEGAPQTIQQARQFHHMTGNGYRPILPSSSSGPTVPFREEGQVHEGQFGLGRTAEGIPQPIQYTQHFNQVSGNSYRPIFPFPNRGSSGPFREDAQVTEAQLGLSSPTSAIPQNTPLHSATSRGRIYSPEASPEPYGPLFSTSAPGYAHAPLALQPGAQQGARFRNSEGRAVCTWPNCFKTYVDNRGVNRHIITHHLQQRNWICQACGDSYQDKSSLKKHIERLGHLDNRF